MDIENWRTAALIFAAVGQTLFVLLYMTFPWWRSFLGRSLFFKAVSLGVLVDVAVFARLYDLYEEEATFVILYWLLGLGIWAQFIAFLRVRSQHRQDTVVSGNEGDR